MTMVTERSGSAPARLATGSAAGLPSASAITLLMPDQWKVLRSLRLAALADSRDQFLARLDVERKYKEAKWRDELARDEWFAYRLADGTGVAILRIDEVSDAQAPDFGRRHLGYMWVRPDCRRSGVGREMVLAALRRLSSDRRREYAYLYVFTGNVPALNLYKELGFEPVGQPKPLLDGSGRDEQLMQFRLADAGAAARRGQAR